jgi:hypothetical protein
MPSTAHPTLNLAIFPGLIQHYPDCHVLYCKPCNAVVFPTALSGHLGRYHKVHIDQRRLLDQHCQSLELVAQRKDLQLPADQSLALQFLPVHAGYSCCKCRFLTIAESMMRGHVNQAHQLTYQACTDNYCSVQLQTWFSKHTARYWVVRRPAAKIAAAQKHDALKQLELDEIRRLEQLEQDYTAQADTLPDPESNTWLRWTQWPAQFASLPLDVVANSAVQPKKALDSDYILGAWAGDVLKSPLANEVKLLQLVQLLDTLFDRCSATLAGTPQLLRC